MSQFHFVYDILGFAVTSRPRQTYRIVLMRFGDELTAYFQDDDFHRSSWHNMLQRRRNCADVDIRRWLVVRSYSCALDSHFHPEKATTENLVGDLSCEVCASGVPEIEQACWKRGRDFR